MRRLTVAGVRAASKPGLYGDGGTLFLRVAPGGSKGWIQRLTIAGKRHDIGLGGFPLVSLAEARDAAFDNRRLARRGGDPLAAKRKAKTPTFRVAAVKTFEANRARWRNNKTTANWLGGRVAPGDYSPEALTRTGQGDFHHPAPPLMCLVAILPISALQLVDGEAGSVSAID